MLSGSSKNEGIAEAWRPFRQKRIFPINTKALKAEAFRVLHGRRLRLIKIAARVIETASRVRLAFAAGCPEADLFRSLPAALMPCGP
jgi:hypothetical protein